MAADPEPLFTRVIEGMGLGLAVRGRIAEGGAADLFIRLDAERSTT
jgi:hypothetical protein